MSFVRLVSSLVAVHLRHAFFQPRSLVRRKRMTDRRSKNTCRRGELSHRWRVTLFAPQQISITKITISSFLNDCARRRTERVRERKRVFTLKMIVLAPRRHRPGEFLRR